jgi:hypothetical protein
VERAVTPASAMSTWLLLAEAAGDSFTHMETDHDSTRSVEFAH